MTKRDKTIRKWFAKDGSFDELYDLGRRDGIEEAAAVMDNLSANWVGSLPIDEVQSLNCKQYAKAIRSLAETSVD